MDFDANLLVIFLAGLGGVGLSIGLAVWAIRKYGQEEELPDEAHAEKEAGN